ncbi:MAG: helix-turn-helix domain-containing protein [Armatimonadota bacterium]
MANYDNRLGEWFKQVERSAQELKKKKTDDVPVQIEETTEPVEQISATSQPRPVSQPALEGLAVEKTESAVATIESPDIDESTVGEPRPHMDKPVVGRVVDTPGLFDDNDVSPVEDFFSFLDHKSEHDEQTDEAQVTQPQPTVLIGSEGTGVPRPIISEQQTEQSQPVHVPETSFRQPVAEPTVITAKEEPAVRQDPNLQENWDRMPHHLQTLFGIAGEEVAQNSYKAFKENRGELIQRLLDPPLTLEEAARILNVCPTTVRRYTNRGVLAHFRTAGNQRRFRLSDVLSFMESNGRSISDAD